MVKQIKMIKEILSFVALIVVVNAVGETDKWRSFKVQFSRMYRNPKEEQKRFAIFVENLQKIESHNEKYEQGLVSYKMGVNKFADMTKGEFALLMGLVGTREISTTNTTFKIAADADVPNEINWIDSGAVTAVKLQGGSGSCWSFSATGAIEGQYYLQNQQLISLSEQNLVDCCSSCGDDGCSGGMMDSAFQYVCDNGIMSEADYPNVGLNESCQFDASKIIVKAKTFVDIESGSESDLKAAVATIGPVSVAVDAQNFQMYAGGIFDDSYCGKDRYSLSHGILAVGYGTTDDGTDYWLVKNSWGQDWGENGYIRMSRNKDNQCGIATLASYPVL